MLLQQWKAMKLTENRYFWDLWFFIVVFSNYAVYEQIFYSKTLSFRWLFQTKSFGEGWMTTVFNGDGDYWNVDRPRYANDQRYVVTTKWRKTSKTTTCLLLPDTYLMSVGRSGIHTSKDRWRRRVIVRCPHGLRRLLVLLRHHHLLLVTHDVLNVRNSSTRPSI